MSLLATQQDFEANGLYSNYYRWPLFRRRAEIIRQTYNPTTVLVIGCGWGFLVDELRNKNIEAWGADLSEYAIRKAHTEVPDSYRHIEKADGRNARHLQRVGPGYFDLAVTEDVLTVCSNEQEVDRFVSAARAVSDQTFHIVTCWLPEQDQYPEKVAGRDSRVLWKYEEEWTALVAPDPILNNFEEIVRHG